MYELIKINENDYYVDCPSRMGIVKISESEVILIDSGKDKDAGKRALRHIKEKGWTLRAVYNTHFHADHIGANRYLAEQTGCKIFAPGVDTALVRHPILEPVSLYGAKPIEELTHKFLVAPESDAQYISEAELAPGLELINLCGHSFDMVGFKTVSGTVFLADAISSKEILDKYRIGVIYDVGAYLQTLDRIKDMKATLFVPSHVAPSDDIRELVCYNIENTQRIADKICEICSEPISFERILQRLFSDFELVMTFEQHSLVGSTVRSYLTYLVEQGRVKMYFEDNMLLFSKI